MADRNFKINVSIEGIKQGVKDFADLTGATKAYKAAQEAAGKAGKAYQAVAEKTNKVIDNTKKALSPLGKLFQGAQKAAGSFGKGLSAVGKGLGGLLKATGIGAIIGALTGAFSKAQPVMDAFAVAANVIQTVIAKISEAIFDNLKAQSEMNGGFDNTKKVIGGLIKGALNILLGAIKGIVLIVKEVQLAWEKSIFGDGDPKEIKRLNKEIETTKDELKEIGKNIVESGKQVADNFVGAIEEAAGAATAIVEGVITATENLDFDQLIDDAKNLEELKKAAARADIERQKVQLQYQKTQEELRQLRDDEQKNLSDRIKANADILKSQEEQFKKEKALINTKIAAAQAIYNQSKTEEDLNALAATRLELADLEERITGQRSEALANQNALTKEQIELQKTLGQISLDEYESTQRRLAEDQKAAADRATIGIKDTRKLAEAQYQIQKEYLAAQLALEQDLYNQRSEDIDNRIKQIEESGQTETQAYADLLAEKSAMDQEYADTAMDLNNQVADNEAANNQRIIDDKKALNEAILNTSIQAAQGLASLADELAKGEGKRAKAAFQVSKGINLAAAITSTYAAITKTLKEPSLPFPANVIASVGIGAQGLAQVLKIRNTKFEAPSDSAGSDEKITPPKSKFASGGLLSGPSHGQGGIKTSFGELEGGEYVVNRRATARFFPVINAINSAGKRKYAEGGVAGMDSGLEDVLANLSSPVVKTYVVASDMTSQQEADKRVSDIARL